MSATGSRVVAFSDGASKGNPGPGGWGAVVCDGDTVTELGGADPSTTNNRMEMEAAIQALRAAPGGSTPVALYTDSTYLIHGITRWIHGWKRKGWKTSQGADVLNRDLWEELDRLTRRRRVEWHHVPGHAGIAANERVDQIASGLALGEPVDLYRGPAAQYPVDLSPPVGGRPEPANRSPRNRKKSGKAHCYLSLVGGVLQRHASWSECEARVRGVSGARFKKAMSADEEARILAEWGVAREA